MGKFKMRTPNLKGVKSPLESDDDRVGTTRSDSTIVYNEDGTVDSTPVGHTFADTSGNRYAQSMKRIRDKHATTNQLSTDAQNADRAPSVNLSGMKPTRGE
jgi:hypothetical protein